MYKNLDQLGNTVGVEFDLDLWIAELAARETCLGEVVTRGTSQVFKYEVKKN